MERLAMSFSKDSLLANTLPADCDCGAIGGAVAVMLTEVSEGKGVRGRKPKNFLTLSRLRLGVVIAGYGEWM